MITTMDKVTFFFVSRMFFEDFLMPGQEKLIIFAHEINVDRFGQLATTVKNAKYSLHVLDAYLPNDTPFSLLLNVY